MLWFLKQIWCAIMQIPYFIIWAAITTFNLLVIALAATAVALVALLPTMPTFDGWGGVSWLTTSIGWANWLFPLGVMVESIVYVAGLWLTIVGIQALLRWVKVIT